MAVQRRGKPLRRRRKSAVGGPPRQFSVEANQFGNQESQQARSRISAVRRIPQPTRKRRESEVEQTGESAVGPAHLSVRQRTEPIRSPGELAVRLAPASVWRRIELIRDQGSEQFGGPLRQFSGESNQFGSQESPHLTVQGIQQFGPPTFQFAGELNQFRNQRSHAIRRSAPAVWSPPLQQWERQPQQQSAPPFRYGRAIRRDFARLPRRTGQWAAPRICWNVARIVHRRPQMAPSDW
jgi:hypothetical protein